MRHKTVEDLLRLKALLSHKGVFLLWVIKPLLVLGGAMFGFS